MNPIENSFEDSRQDGNLNSSPRIFRDLEKHSNKYVRFGANPDVNNRPFSSKRNWGSLRSSWDGIDFIEKMMDDNRRLESLGPGFLDNTGSIGEAISKLIAASKRRAQRVIPPALEQTEASSREEEDEKGLSKHEQILVALNSYTVRKSLAEKAIVRWYELVAQFNEISRTMSDPVVWEEYVSKAFSEDVNIRISEQFDGEGENTCFEFCFPMLCVIWDALRRCGQKGLEIKPTRPRAQALSNGSIVIEDPGCCFTSQWRGGSRLERKFDLKASLDLSFVVQWVDLKYIDRAVADWYALGEVIQASLFDSQMVSRMAQLVRLAQTAGGLSQVTPQSEVEALSSPSPSSSNEAAIKELNSHMKAFSHLSDTSSHQLARKTFQMADVMSSLKDLLVYQKEKQIASPLETLDHYVSQGQSRHSAYSEDVGRAARVGNLRTSNSTPSISDLYRSFENPSTISSAKRKGHGKRMKTENRTRAMTAASSTSLAALRLSSSRISKEKTGGSNVIPGTKKIRF